MDPQIAPRPASGEGIRVPGRAAPGARRHVFALATGLAALALAAAACSSISFGVFKTAQALGDRQALLDAGRRVIRVDLGKDVGGGLRRLTERPA